MFEKIIGYADIKRELEMILDTIIHPEKYKMLGAKISRNILLHGDPGVGKSSLAWEFVKESGRRSYVIRKDRPDGEFVHYIKETFDKARENQPSIVMCEDICKWANEDACRSDAEEYVTLQSCIDENIESSADVVVVATANASHRLPRSLTRRGRFHKEIEVKYPTGECAVKIVEHYLEGKEIDPDVSAYEVARLLDGQSCATLESVVTEAALYTGFEGRERINRSDLIRAAMRIIFDAPESSEPVREEDARRLAVHEIGHAICAEVQEPGAVDLVSINRHGGSIGGITSYTNNESYFYSAKYMEQRVVALLGGKAATELVFGAVDVGCNSDMHRAFDIVERFVDNYCAFGFDKFERQSSSPALRTRKEDFVHSELDRYYRRAKDILTTNRALLDVLVDELVEKKTLTGEEIRAEFARFYRKAG